MSDLRVLVASSEGSFALSVRDIVAAQLPNATCEIVDPSRLRPKPDAAALVIDCRGGGPDGVKLAGRQRAIGFAGAIVLVSPPIEQPENAGARAGFTVVSPDRLATDLMPQLAEQLRFAESPYAPQVIRARRLVAAGEIAQTLQHSLNNALMGLLAEAQLMQLDQPSSAHAAALERMVALCRTMVAITRKLDGLSERSATS